jgi:8-amino-7-oxononanoate synthase
MTTSTPSPDIGCGRRGLRHPCRAPVDLGVLVVPRCCRCPPLWRSLPWSLVPFPQPQPTHPLAWLEPHAERRRAAGLRRELRPRAADESLLDLAGNDYLGLAADPRVVEGAVRAARTWGAGATGSRLVTGTTALHVELEDELAGFLGAEAALVFSSGYAANLGVLTALTGPDTLIVSDAANHASLVDACRLSRAGVAVVPRGPGGVDPAAVDAELAARAQARAVVVTESVNSIDGGLTPLAALHAVCRRRGALLVVDEAHGLGVIGPGGRGLLAEIGLAGADDVVTTVTLSKSLGSQGGAVLGPKSVIAHLVDTARSFIFDTGLAPPSAGAALSALQVLRAEPERPGAVLRVAAALAEAARVPAPPSAVVAVVLGEPDVAVAAARTCAERGLRVGCFRPPSVPEGTSRLRLTARATVTDAEIAMARTVLADVLAPIGAR